jgi:hypothetical protein
MKFARACAAVVASTLGGCVVDDVDEESVDTSELDVDLNIRRSLVVTNDSMLTRFTMRRVLDQLAGQLRSGYSGATLFRDWWDTQNDAAHSQGGPVHCSTSMNSYPLACPRQEGLLAAVGLRDSGTDSWVPIALFNRFDLAPADGSHCGEYRLELGKRPESVLGFLDRTLVIFEAQMPNPDPARGRAGCEAIVEFWAGLSSIDSPAVRAGLLEHFYFTGLEVDHDGDPMTDRVRLPPVISAAHYAADTGQIRTNQFMTFRPYFERGILFQPWQLREFKLQPGCPGGVCIAQVPVKNNPFAKLFSDSTTHPRGAAFKDFFATPEVMLELSRKVHKINIDVPLEFDAGESTQQGIDNDYIAHFDPHGPFAHRIDAALQALGQQFCPDGGCPTPIVLTASDMVQRATTQSCAGCHQLSNNDALGGGAVWPSSLVFTHVSETVTRDCEPFVFGTHFQGLCFLTSPALDTTFLPHRLNVMRSFLVNEAM